MYRLLVILFVLVMTHQETAVLAGGCFWCIEAQLQRIKGVQKVESGYTGGSLQNPTYQQVKKGQTGHYQVVKVTFNPEMLSYFQLLNIFFSIHDSTQSNGQGEDIGTQYKSAIFYVDKKQEELAHKKIAELESEGINVSTSLLPLQRFYSAEDYHQNYWNTKGQQNTYCQIIPPKLRKLQQKFKDYYVEAQL